MDYQLFKAISDRSLLIKEVYGVGTTITLEGNDYTDKSRYGILISYDGTNNLLSLIRMHSNPSFNNLSGSMISNISYSNDVITITLSSLLRVSGLLLDDDTTKKITIA